MADNDKPKLLKAIVAKGRTVVVGRQSVPEGKEVTLPEDEIASLRASGFLVDPDAPEIPRGDGPAFRSNEGVGIRVAA